MKMLENEKTRFGALIATGIIAIFFLGSSAFFYVDNKDLKQENEVITKQAETLSSVKEQLRMQLKEVDAELAQYKGKNQELDNLLNSAYKELTLKKNKINKLLKENTSLARFKKETKSLKKLQANYLAQIKKMEEKINYLNAENKSLKSDNEKLNDEMRILMNNYMVLERKVAIASILKVENALASAEKKNKNGKYSKVFNPKKTDRMVIDFELSDNNVAGAGEKNIYIRIIDPAGNLLPASSNEKGYFSNPDGNIEMPYTLVKKVDYNNDKLKTTAYYGVENMELKDGTYTIEFYCEGHFCGASKYNMK